MGWFLRHRRTFTGGLFLPDEKALTARKPIEDLEIRWPLDVPLGVLAELPTKPCVREGQQVACGEVLADGLGDASLPVRSPINGVVTEIGRVWTARGGFVASVRLEPSDLKNNHSVKVAGGIAGASLSEVGEIARSSGILAGANQALHARLASAASGGLEALIVNAVETEPNLTGDLRLLVEREEELVETIEWLAGVESGAVFRRAYLAVALRHGRLVRQLQRRVSASNRIRIAALEDKYPQCHPALLCKVIVGRAPQPGQTERDVGALVLPLATIAALAEARRGNPFVRRVVTVSGDAVARPTNLLIPFGTPIHRVIEHVGLRRRPTVALAGGPMTGIPLPDVNAVTSAEVAGITLLSRLPRSEPIACVRCGWCVEDCPAGIDPRALSQLELQREFSKAEQASLAACIECGVCTYVCPSQLPLAEAIGQCRRRLDRSSAE